MYIQYVALHFSIDFQPYAHCPARMEVPVQLPIAAVVSVDGRDSSVKKVWTFSINNDCHGNESIRHLGRQCEYVYIWPRQA